MPAVTDPPGELMKSLMSCKVVGKLVSHGVAPDGHLGMPLRRSRSQTPVRSQTKTQGRALPHL